MTPVAATPTFLALATGEPVSRDGLSGRTPDGAASPAASGV